jgi:uncharacterized DUF497 family protein
VFEWDASKAATNLRKHGVSFDEAATVFADPDALDGPDLAHSAQEARSLRVGRSLTGRVLMVGWTIRGLGDDEKIRIIRASGKERAAYASGSAD